MCQPMTNTLVFLLGPVTTSPLKTRYAIAFEIIDTMFLFPYISANWHFLHFITEDTTHEITFWIYSEFQNLSDMIFTK